MSMNNRIVYQLSQMVADHELNSKLAVRVEETFMQEFDNWLADKVEQLEQLVREWESAFPDGDSGMYSLGIRRAIDVVTGRSALDQLPILETEDTPDEPPSEQFLTQAD